MGRQGGIQQVQAESESVNGADGDGSVVGWAENGGTQSVLCKACPMVPGGRLAQMRKIRAGMFPNRDFPHWTRTLQEAPKLSHNSSHAEQAWCGRSAHDPLVQADDCGGGRCHVARTPGRRGSSVGSEGCNVRLLKRVVEQVEIRLDDEGGGNGRAVNVAVQPTPNQERPCGPHTPGDGVLQNAKRGGLLLSRRHLGVSSFFIGRSWLNGVLDDPS